MNALKKAATIVEEKSGPRAGLLSSFRVVLVAMALAWIIRFLAEPVAVIGFALSGDSTGYIVTPLSEPMSWLGVAIIFAGPFERWMRRTEPGDIPAALAATLGALFGKSISTPSNISVTPTTEGAPLTPPPDSLPFDNSEAHDESNEPA